MDSGVGGFLRTERRKPSVINIGDFDLPEPTSPPLFCGMKFRILYLNKYHRVWENDRILVKKVRESENSL